MEWKSGGNYERKPNQGIFKVTADIVVEKTALDK
jgi:hypothetical protein